MSPTPTHPSSHRSAPASMIALAGALTGLLLSAPTSSALAAPTTPQVTSPPAQPASITQALQRDLDLSPSQTAELLSAQDEAITLTRDASRAAGDAYVDARWDPSTHALTVSVTDATTVEAVEATGAEVEVVDHDPARLEAALDALTEATAPEGVVGWYGDPFEGKVVIEALDPDQGWALAEAFGVTPETTRVVRVDEAAVPYAQVIGGHPYTVGGARCIIGFSAIASNGQEGFLTAGHCGRAGDTVQSVPAGATGEFAHSRFPGADGAFVAVGPEWELTPWVARYGQDPYLTIRGSVEAPVGSVVCSSSPNLGWQCGVLQARDQTVRYPEGIVQGLSRTDLCSQPGESGAPVVAGDQAQGMISGGSGSPGTGCLTFFQDVNPMLDTWGLTLFTA